MEQTPAHAAGDRVDQPDAEDDQHHAPRREARHRQDRRTGGEENRDAGRRGPRRQSVGGRQHGENADHLGER